MKLVLQPWHFFLVVLVGWVHREQQWIIEPHENVRQQTGEIKCHERLGGMLWYDYRDAA